MADLKEQRMIAAQLAAGVLARSGGGSVQKVVQLYRDILKELREPSTEEPEQTGTASPGKQDETPFQRKKRESRQANIKAQHGADPRSR